MLTNIRSLDYVVLLCEDMERMQDFYHDLPGFPIYRDWDGLQEMPVDGCHAELLRKVVEILEAPRNWEHRHRTLFFKDPKGNILEIYSDIRYTSNLRQPLKPSSQCGVFWAYKVGVA